MTDQRMTLFQHLGESVLSTAGDTPSSSRTVLTHYTAQLCNAASKADISIPSELASYVKKVALHAYQVMEQDVERLRESGYSEDAIFEITLSVAYGAGLNCLGQGLAALQGAKDAIEEH